MTLAIKAPVGDKNRITKPDPKKKNEKFQPVKNAREDVEIVQLMLVANGHSVPVDGKASGALVKAIRAFQKSTCGFQRPDGIVDPGMATWKAGLPKLKARVAANLKELENRVRIVENGKPKIISKAEFEKRQKETLKQFQDKATQMLGQAEVWVDFCTEAEQTMQGQDAVMMQLTEFVVRWANEKAEPPWTKLLNARSEATFLKNEAERTTPDWNKILKQDKKATKAYNEGQKAFKRYIDARIKTASGMVGKLEVARETSFAVVEVYLTAQIMARGRMTPVQAHAAAAATTEAMKSSSGQVGEYLAGNDVTWDGAAKKVAFDTFFAAGAGALGGKLSAGMTKKFAGDFATKFGGKYLKTEAVDKFATAFLKSGGGQAFLENASKEAFMLSKKAIEKGTLTRKDFEEAFMKAATAGMLSGGVGKALAAFDKAVPDVSEKALRLIIDKNVMKNLSGDLERMFEYKLIEKILKEDGDAIVKKVIGSVSGKYTEAKVLEVMKEAKGNESGKQLSKALEDKLRKDQALRKEVKALVEAEVVARARKLEKAR